MPNSSVERFDLSDGGVCLKPNSMMRQVAFHWPKPVASGVRLDRSQQRRLRPPTSDLRPLNHHPLSRLISAILTLLLFFSSSPVLFASMAREAMGSGGSGVGGKGGSANLQNAGAASAALTVANARAVLKQSDAQVAAMKALQVNARSLMGAGNIPNGLAIGGLNPYNPSGLMNTKAPTVPKEWSGVDSLAQSGNDVNIHQSAQNAYLYWNQFNVGQQTSVNFDQSAGGNDVGNWIAFNKVMGNVSPSHIYGQITAQGQVYILNQNGILFHNGSQVNTHALVASTLPINETLAGDSLDKVTGSGIINFPNGVPQFLFTALDKGSYDHNNKGNVTVNGALGDVVVERGATITSPANSSHSGGLVALVGPNVRNAGSINTPNGQTILASGLQVGISAHSSGDPSLRGLDVAVGKVSDPTVKTLSTGSGDAENTGILSVPEGNATITGKTVNQHGVIDSSTSVSLNGRIDLMASYGATINGAYLSDGTKGPAFIPQNMGVIDMSEGSVMRILPEWNATETTVGSALPLNSVISLIGQNIHLANNAIIQAPGAVATQGAIDQSGQSLASGVTVSAGSWYIINNIPAIINDTGTIAIDSGATITVAGSTGVNMSSDDNFLKVQLRGAELANSPLQRIGSIRGTSLTIDARITGSYNGQYWIGTPLGDASGFANLLSRNVSQLTTSGGSVSLQAGDSVVMQGGSTVDVSGGWVNYPAAKVATTKLIYQGHLVDISRATPDQVYSGVYSGGGTVETSTKWGVTKKYGQSPLDPTTIHNEPSYVSGASGGSINIKAPAIVLNGSLLGTTVVGPKQLRQSASTSTLPTGSTLNLTLGGSQVDKTLQATFDVSPYAPSVSFAENMTSSQNALFLRPDLISSHGFGTLNIRNHDGTITVPSGVTLNAPVNGSITLEAANVDVEGSIIAPGGAVSLMADLVPYSVIHALNLEDTSKSTEPILDIVQYQGKAVAQYGPSVGGVTQIVNTDGSIATINGKLPHLNAGIVTIGPVSQISTAGTVLNDIPNSVLRYQPIALDAGSITIAGYQVNATKGSILDVSGGALMPPNGSVSYGNAGSISIVAGQDTYIVSNGKGQSIDNGIKTIHNGSLLLGSTLKGYAGAGSRPGTLSITAPAILIGGNSTDSRVLQLSPDFFSQGGFGTFNLTGVGLKESGTIDGLEVPPIFTSAANAVNSTPIVDYIPAIEIASGTRIQPQVASSMLLQSTKGPSLQTFLQSSPLRPTANITLNGTGLIDSKISSVPNLLIRGDIVMAEGASVELNPQLIDSKISSIAGPLTSKITSDSLSAKGGSITLTANTVTILGSIKVPGGSISVTGASVFPENVIIPFPTGPQVTVDIAPTANLSTAGEALFMHDPSGVKNQFGTVLSGGSISLSGNILAEKGAILDVSGASGIYDLFPSQLGIASSTYSRSTLRTSTVLFETDSSGGTISLTGKKMIYSDATLKATAGGPSALGGTLNISSGNYYKDVVSSLNSFQDVNLTVTQRGTVSPSTFQKSGFFAIGQQLLPTSQLIPANGGHLAVDSFAGGGFDSINFGGNVLFDGSQSGGAVSISVPGQLRVATTGFLAAKDNTVVNLSATRVALGMTFLAPLGLNSAVSSAALGASTYAAPTWGNGSLNVNARIIDIGNLSLRGIGNAVLNAPGGIIRGDGTFDMAGNLSINAAQIYPVSGTVFNVIDYNHIGAKAVSTGGIPGTIQVNQVGSLGLPLSAAGSISLYAANIVQGGVIVAPFGNINLGCDGTQGSPIDPITGAGTGDAAAVVTSVPTATSVILQAGSLTSISALDPLSGTRLSIPYGTSSDGTSWVDLSGTDITTTALPSRGVTIGALNVVTAAGSQIDLRGGGSVTANYWISGNGGKINILGDIKEAFNQTRSYSAGDLVTYNGATWSARQAISGVTPSVSLYWSQVQSSYAVIPGYSGDIAPTGYSDGTVSIGSKVTLQGVGGLPSGTYTLLPSRYANQPGAYLITPVSSSLSLGGTIQQPDGSFLASGRLFNGLSFASTPSEATTLFQVSTPKTIAQNVQYQILSADQFFKSSTTSHLPSDAGNLTFKAVTSMALLGGVSGQGSGTGRWASIDISAPLNVNITANGGNAAAGLVTLSANALNGWNYGSLLVGGLRGAQQNGLTPITVTAKNISVSGDASLVGNDLILAANQSITLGAGASIITENKSSVPDTQLSVVGNGILLRASSDPNLTLSRKGVSSQAIQLALKDANGNSITPTLSLGDNASISSTSLVLDSSAKATIAPSVLLQSKNITIDAGAIAMLINPSLSLGSLDASDANALVLRGNVLAGLSTSTKLSLASYSTLDLYGAGSFGLTASSSSLALLAGEIRGFGLAGSTAALSAGSIFLDNISGVPSPGPVAGAAANGTLDLKASTISIGNNTMAIDQFVRVAWDASQSVIGTGVGGISIGTQSLPSDFSITTPLITGLGNTATTLTSTGILALQSSGSSAPGASLGLGGKLTLQGSSVAINTALEFSSGSISVRATTGDINIGNLSSALLDVSGGYKSIYDVTRYFDAGNISLTSDAGNVNITASSSLDLKADPAAGSAGNLSVTAPKGTALFAGKIAATAPSGGRGGNFTADLKTYNGGNIDTLENLLSTAGVTESQNIRIRSGDVTLANAKAHSYTLTADAGSILVKGKIDASGATGGSIVIQAGGSVVLDATAGLTVQAGTYDAAGKGGSIFLSAGNEINGVISPTAMLDLQGGSSIDLGVGAPATRLDQMGGTLHLRAPQNAAGTDIQIAHLDSTIRGASSIPVEGYQLYDLTPGGGGSAEISTAVPQITIDAPNFFGAAGANSANAATILARLTLNQPLPVSNILNLAPGVEIINQNGDLTLNTDWDFSQLRVGNNSSPGFLSLRASGNIILNATLSDGFSALTFDSNGNPIAGSAYNAPLMDQNAALPANFQSWAYQITAGADLSGANSKAVAKTSLGNVILGIPYANASQAQAPVPGSDALTSDALTGPGYNYYQVIRTGTGDISINASGDLQLWNQFASIYTAGVQVVDPNLGGTFDTPSPSNYGQDSPQLRLGAVQQLVPYAAQFSYAGGNITVDVMGNIGQWALDASATAGSKVADSVRELPSNWLYRRGSVDANGKFSVINVSPDTLGDPNVKQVASTAWWVDFSNFFDDLGALGGGNIILNAGGNINNINASIPTNYRMSGKDASGKLISASSATGIELGGGNLSVRAGNNLDAGVYYVERGNASLQVGGSIITNPTRDPAAPTLTAPIFNNSSLSYLPTSFFLGKGNISVQAAGDVLIGSVANVFMTPQGINNGYWLKDYFTSYAPTDTVSVSSLGGNITLRQSAATQASSTPVSILQSWIASFLNPYDPGQASYYQPWIRLVETDITSDSIPTSAFPVGLAPLISLMPPSLDVLALSGDINLQGNLTMMPSPTGTISLIAAKNINGLVQNGIYKASVTSSLSVYSAAILNLSDADPALFPGISAPLSQRSNLPANLVNNIKANGIKNSYTTGISRMLYESGSVTGQFGVLQSKQALHGSSLLHGGDTVPLRIYAQKGDISGLTLFSPKSSIVAAGADITDIGLYLQNDTQDSFSIVSAGGKIIAYDPLSPLQKIAQAALNNTALYQSGDIQINGPGTLEVLAGGNIDLGNGPNNSDGTGVGITSIGNNRNPNLPFAGADIIVGSGVNLPSGLSSPEGLALQNFVNTVIKGSDGATYLSELADTLTYSGDPLAGKITQSSFDTGSTVLSDEEKARLELQLFYIVLRDTGRNHNKVGSTGYGNYTTGEQAIKSFFANSSASGEITTWFRDVRTKSGGNISMFAPGGGLTLGNTAGKPLLTPPGIVTEHGGAINIYTEKSVSIGIGRIFTLRGGDIMIWSNLGDIAAGSSAKTVVSAPPTRVLIDAQSANVQTDLAGLATGGGIGVLATVADVPAGNVDLIAPSGAIDAGDAGIRATGNLNLAATKILNADNITVSGTTAGAPPAAAPPAAPNISGATAAAAAGAASTSTAATASSTPTPTPEPPASVISVEVLGYGGGDGADESSSTPSTSSGTTPPPQASL